MNGPSLALPDASKPWRGRTSPTPGHPGRALWPFPALGGQFPLAGAVKAAPRVFQYAHISGRSATAFFAAATAICGSRSRRSGQLATLQASKFADSARASLVSRKMAWRYSCSASLWRPARRRKSPTCCLADASSRWYASTEGSYAQPSPQAQRIRGIPALPPESARTAPKAGPDDCAESRTGFDNHCPLANLQKGSQLGNSPAQVRLAFL